ncbi:hypothetical protein V5799_010671 [Amblyomma americanum]|uniref:Transmembrane protein n=1 Tax=Amblyomma americanum TaxID=6943 RepID=A0AAQ4EK26_AMBAM
MHNITASTTQNETFSKTPPTGLLAKILALKGLPALAAFGALLVVCVLLVGVLLVYMLAGNGDPSREVASAPSVTPDKEDDVTSVTGGNKSEITANTTGGTGPEKTAGSAKPSKGVPLNSSATAKPRRLHDTFGRIYRSLSPGQPISTSASASDSDSTVALNESIQRSRTSESNNSPAGVARENSAQINGGKRHLQLKIAMLVGLDGSGHTFTPPGSTATPSSGSANSSRDYSKTIKIVQGSGAEPLPEVQMPRPAHPIASGDAAADYPLAEPTTVPTEKSVLLNYAAAPRMFPSAPSRGLTH